MSSQVHESGITQTPSSQSENSTLHGASIVIGHDADVPVPETAAVSNGGAGRKSVPAATPVAAAVNER